MKAAGGEKVAQKAIELAREGFCYSQILVALSLAHQRKTNRDLIRAMEGLKGGLGFSDKICGSLTGAVCLLGLYAWRGSFSEKPDPRLDLMVLELIERFEEKIGEKYGGIDCDQITEECLGRDLYLICAGITMETYLKTASILRARGFDLQRGRGD